MSLFTGLKKIGNATVAMFSDGSSVKLPAYTDWIPFTPTGSWTSNTTYTGLYKRVGDTMSVQVKVVTSGAPTATNLTINIPFSLVIDTSKIINIQTDGGMTNATLGLASIVDLGSATYQGFVGYFANNLVKIQVGSDAASFLKSHSPVTNTNPFTFGSTDVVCAWFSVPIVGW